MENLEIMKTLIYSGHGTIALLYPFFIDDSGADLYDN